MARFLAFLIWLTTAGTAWAQGQGIAEADKAAIRRTIERQLDAFRRDDGAAAFAIASPEIQRQFGSPEVFMHMVRVGYPQVYRPQEVDFRQLVVADGVPNQAVLVVGPDGAAVMAVYRMQKQPDGSWRIDGCALIKTGETAT